jgi:ParB-like chromosome segregation protein Spo0J
MEEAQGFKALLDLEDPTYSIEQIAAKTGKQPVFVAARLKLIDLVPAAVEAFYRNEIGVGHALLLAKLPADQQEQAFSACFREDWGASSDRKAKRILLPVRSLSLIAGRIGASILFAEVGKQELVMACPFWAIGATLPAIATRCASRLSNGASQSKAGVRRAKTKAKKEAKPKKLGTGKSRRAA